MQFQRRDGLWTELSPEHPVPVQVMNPSQKTINVTIDERGDVTVTNWPDTEKVVVTNWPDIELQSLVERLGTQASLLRGITQRLDSAMFVIDQHGALIKYLLIAQGITALATLAVLVIAIVR